MVWCRDESDEYSNRGILDNTDLYNVFNFIPTLRQTKPRERPEAAICVRKSSARRVLHFTPLITASCVLHRPANRVIHRLQLYLIQLFIQFEYGTGMYAQVNGQKRIVTRLSRHCTKRQYLSLAASQPPKRHNLSLHSLTCAHSKVRTSATTRQSGLDT